MTGTPQQVRLYPLPGPPRGAVLTVRANGPVSLEADTGTYAEVRQRWPHRSEESLDFLGRAMDLAAALIAGSDRWWPAMTSLVWGLSVRGHLGTGTDPFVIQLDGARRLIAWLMPSAWPEEAGAIWVSGVGLDGVRRDAPLRAEWPTPVERPSPAVTTPAPPAPAVAWQPRPALNLPPPPPDAFAADLFAAADRRDGRTIGVPP